MSSEQKNKASAPIYITETLPNDVLLGRGSHLVRYRGNIAFRLLIQTRRDEYIYALHTSQKDAIAQEIISIVASKNGRFLRKVKDDEKKKLKIPSSVTSPWVPANTEVVLEKVKQAFRDSCKDDPTLKLVAKRPVTVNTSSEVVRTEGPTSNTTAQTLQQDYPQEQENHFQPETQTSSAPQSNSLGTSYVAINSANDEILNRDQHGISRPSLDQLVAADSMELQYAARVPPLSNRSSHLAVNDNLEQLLMSSLPHNPGAALQAFRQLGSLSSSNILGGSYDDISRYLQMQQHARNLSHIYLDRFDDQRTSSLSLRQHIPSLPSNAIEDIALQRQLLFDQYASYGQLLRDPSAVRDTHALQQQLLRDPAILQRQLLRNTNTLQQQRLLRDPNTLQFRIPTSSSLSGDNAALQRLLMNNQNRILALRHAVPTSSSPSGDHVALQNVSLMNRAGSIGQQNTSGQERNLSQQTSSRPDNG